MKKSIIILFFLFVEYLNAQNLVPNYSFETNTAPYDSSFQGCLMVLGGFNTGQIPLWDSPSAGNPDPYDTCAPQFSSAGVPNSSYGYQMPHTGHGMGGVTLFESNGFREYIQAPLISPLVAGKKYCASFFINLADTVIIACNNFGIYFSDIHIYDGANQNNLPYVPQINSTTIVTDQFNWTEITGEYTAHGGENYIIIGNFYPNNQTDTTLVVGWNVGSWAYYFIDDVTVRDCTHDGVEEEEWEGQCAVYPNPAKESITIESTKYKLQSIKIMDIIGKEILQTASNSVRSASDKQQTTIDMSGFAKGIYFVQVLTENGITTKKVVKE